MTNPEFRRDVFQLPGQFTGFAAQPREFASGNLGWSAAESAFIAVGGQQVRCRVRVQIVVEGSKHWAV